MQLQGTHEAAGTRQTNSSCNSCSPLEHAEIVVNCLVDNCAQQMLLHNILTDLRETPTSHCNWQSRAHLHTLAEWCALTICVLYTY
jgi:hypothetical protein